MARETLDVKIVPQLNNDLFSFTKAMKEGWQMNGRWKEGGLIIDLLKTTRASTKFDRMILLKPKSDKVRQTDCRAEI